VVLAIIEQLGYFGLIDDHLALGVLAEWVDANEMMIHRTFPFQEATMRTFIDRLLDAGGGNAFYAGFMCGAVMAFALIANIAVWMR
jgi:hypothetical protein